MAVDVEYVLKLNDKLSQKLSTIQSKVEKLNGNVHKTQSSFAGLGGVLARIGGAVAIGSAIKSVASLGVEMEQTRVAFATFLGDAEKGNIVLKELNQFANVTPFDNKQVIKAGRTLLAFGIQANELKPTLKTLGDISAGTGKDLSELGVIYGQIKGAGRLMGQDLLQLINAGFNPLQKISERTGESMLSLKKKMEAGQISFEMVSDEFKRATSEGGQFFNLMEKQSKTVGGRFSTLLGKLQLVGIQLGEALLPVLGVLVDFGIAIVENAALLETLAVVVGVGVAAFGAFKAAMLVQAIVTSQVTAAQWLLNIAMNANPIGLIVAGIAALVAGFILAWKHSETFRGVILGLWEVLKSVGIFIKELFLPAIQKLVLGFKIVGNSIFTALIAPFLQVKNVTSGIFDFISDKITTFLGFLAKIPGVAKVINKFREGFDKGIVVKTAEATTGFDERPSKKLTGSAVTPIPTGNLKAGIAGVKSSAPKIFNINIDKLVEALNISTTNMQDSAARIKEEVQKALLTAVTDASIISE